MLSAGVAFAAVKAAVMATNNVAIFDVRLLSLIFMVVDLFVCINTTKLHFKEVCGNAILSRCIVKSSHP